MRRNTYRYHRLLKDGLLEIVVYDETAINEHVPPGQFELNKNPKSYMPSYVAMRTVEISGKLAANGSNCQHLPASAS